MAEFELNENLRNITPPRKKDPNIFLAKISVVEIKFWIKIRVVKKSATILPVGKRDYAQVMTITSTITKATQKREATPK